MPAPVALFAYRRPQHLEQTIEALRANPEARETALYVFSDAPKDASAAAGVEQVRGLLGRINGFASVQCLLRAENFGLARNITNGVSEVLGLHDTVIVVEDDIVVSPFFLRFMNDALSCYRDEARVGNISGYCYPVAGSAPEAYFIRGADCWGWATWRDRWQCFNPDGRDLLAQLRSRNLVREFDFDGADDRGSDRRQERIMGGALARQLLPARSADSLSGTVPGREHRCRRVGHALHRQRPVPRR